MCQEALGLSRVSSQGLGGGHRNTEPPGPIHAVDRPLANVPREAVMGVLNSTLSQSQKREPQGERDGEG